MPKRPPIHRPIGSRRTAAYLAAQYARTPERKARQSLYDHEWRAYSRRRLSVHPYCVRCERLGRISLAIVTDHIRPHKGNPDLFRDPDNHQSLCKLCHDRKTRLEDGGGALPSIAKPAPRA
jgi:5-methylcytosine-specific restriction protein A